MINLSPSAIVRKQARITLKGNYVAAVAAFLILLSPLFILEALGTVIDMLLVQTVSDKQTLELMEILILTPICIAAVVLLSPLFNGYVRLFYQAAYTKKMNMNDVFYYFSAERYQNTLHLNMLMIVRMIFPALLCFLPLLAYYFICLRYMEDFIGTVLYLDAAFLLTALSMILLILYALKYYLVFTLYCEDETADVRQLIRTSKAMMKELKSSAAHLIFSFIPWMLLCLLILPALYVIPYMTQSLCIGAKWMTMKGKQDESIAMYHRAQ